MTAATTTSTRADDGLLRECLAQHAPDVFASSPIVDVAWSRFKLVTSYDVYVVTVELADGARHRVFVKDFGISARPKDDPVERRQRELRVYQDLLSESPLGTARCYGAVWDDTRSRHWLLLEYVDGTPVGYCDLSCWAPAAEGLGAMHGHFARHTDRLRNCSYLVRHDRDFFLSRTDLALSDVGQIAPHLLDRLVPMVRLYASLVPAMVDQPDTLLHGGCRPSNILIRIASDPSRVCVLDWEEAGCGPALVDVAYLLDGIESPTLDPLLDAYERGARSHGFELPPRHDLKYLVNCFRLYMMMNSLSHAVIKNFSAKGLTRLLNVGEHICDALSRRGRQD